jgi:hypothetical protein
LLAIHGRRLIPAPAHGLGSSTAFKRRTSPATLRTGARVQTKLLRLDVHPADFGLPGHIAALDAILRRVQRRSPATYDELVA